MGGTGQRGGGEQLVLTAFHMMLDCAHGALQQGGLRVSIPLRGQFANQCLCGIISSRCKEY